jgi:hypothetical protein
VAAYVSRVPGAELVVFEASAHLAHLEETERFIDRLRQFMSEAEQKNTALGAAASNGASIEDQWRA